MPPFMQELAAGFGTELIYSFVIIVASLMIYYATKELYELSSYKGIKYFRYAFLFFAIAYFFRSFIKFILLYFNVHEIRTISPMLFGNLTLFLFVYFSSLAVFYLLYSIMWKKWNGSKKIYLFHTLSFIIALAITLSRNILTYLVINALLLIFVAIVGYPTYKSSKNARGHNLYATYMLLFLFWILNVTDTLIPNFFQNFQLLLYLASLGIFMSILYKVLKQTGN